MPNSSAIDAALVVRLGSDVTLLALMPNGVYVDDAPPGSTRFVIVSLADEVDEPQFGSRAYESALYLVEAVALSTSGGDVNAAFARIEVLLEDQPLTATGYTPMALVRETRHRLTEVDDLDPSIRWFRRGGHYRVTMAVAPV